jgi:hypothetical protein
MLPSFLGGTLLAQAPEKLPCGLYTETVNESAILFVSTTAVFLNEDATYRTLLQRRGSIRIAAYFGLPSNYLVPGSGDYSYTRTGPDRAVLRFAQIAPTANAWQRSLVFTSPLRGEIYEGEMSIGTFEFTERTVSARTLINISTRVRVRPEEPIIVGFVLEHRGAVLLRVAGPSLAKFGIKDGWKAPDFRLYTADGKLFRLWQTDKIAPPDYTNPSPTWDATEGYRTTLSQAFNLAGAFPFSAGDADVAAVAVLEPANYTVVVIPAENDAGGTALIEVYQIQ